MPLLISILSFVVIMLIFLMWYRDYAADKITVTERIQKHLQRGSIAEARPLDNQDLTARPNDKFWQKSVQKLSQPFENTNWAEKLDHKLVQAGLPVHGSEFIVVCLVVMLFMMVVFMLLSGGNIIMGLIGLGIGYLIPIMYLKMKISARIKAFNAQIADSLVLISSSLRSGYSFMQSLEMVGHEMEPPISVEFYRVLREINLGVTTDEAMNHMAARINSGDLDLVVTAVLVQRQGGGNLAGILDNIANTIRERVKIKGHVRTLTAQGRLSGIIIGLLPVALCVIISLINPEYIYPLFTQPIGQAMVAMAVITEIFGMLLIRNIVDIRI
jgi:Flp pilus assembly protein TadB